MTKRTSAVADLVRRATATTVTAHHAAGVTARQRLQDRDRKTARGRHQCDAVIALVVSDVWTVSSRRKKNGAQDK
jgi:hypothetical protein